MLLLLDALTDRNIHINEYSISLLLYMNVCSRFRASENTALRRVFGTRKEEITED
jgi:hypothetical protein